jgi:hypothetical protein
MMKKHLYIMILVLIFFSKVEAQNKRDYKWLFGIKYISSEKYINGNIMDFNNKGKVDTVDIYDTVADYNAEISDKEGNLLFYYNGCRVVDSTMQLMQNGDSINYGKTWEGYCGNWARYPGLQNSIVLPDPGNETGYYIIHKREEIVYEPILDLSIPELLYTYVDMSGNKGRGKVVKKNEAVFKTTNIVSGYLSACKHANGKDWWLVQMKHYSNIYIKVLLTADTIMAVDSQQIVESPIFTANSGIGQAKFTPDGTKWITNSAEDQCMVYDFERETGELSNLSRVMPQDSGIFYGLAVSPNSRFAYLSNMWDLFQIDLLADDIPASLVHIAHIDHFVDRGFWSKFGQAQLAPDCKIYIVSPGTNHYLHVINKPNEKGKACDFRQHSVFLPNVNCNNSIPNFPHFRIDEDQVCDSTITWIPDEYIVKQINILSVYPNPARDKATISVYSEGYSSGEIEIVDIAGKVLKRMKIDSEEVKTIDVRAYEPGIYLVKYISSDGIRRIEKLVVSK